MVPLNVFENHVPCLGYPVELHHDGASPKVRAFLGNGAFRLVRGRRRLRTVLGPRRLGRWPDPNFPLHYPLLGVSWQVQFEECMPLATLCDIRITTPTRSRVNVCSDDLGVNDAGSLMYKALVSLREKSGLIVGPSRKQK
jgi:hypothetical protein